MKSHGPWKIKKTNDVYLDSFVKVWVDDVVRPDGQDGTHVVVTMKPGVCVLAVDSDNQVHLTDEFHYGVGRHSIEAVSGGIEPGEDPDETARRELREELGIEAESWQFITEVDPFTTIVVSPTRLYLAKGLRFTEASPDGTEQIRRVTMSLDEAIEQVKSGRITHTPTCLLLWMANARLSE